MKNYLIGFVPVTLLTIAVITYVDKGNGNFGDEKNKTQFVQVENASENNTQKKQDACCKVEMAGEHSDNSIYQLKSMWKDQDGNTIKLKKFGGKKVVLAMIYTSCPTACPVIVNDMQKLESSIPEKELSSYHFVLVSIDPQRDSPAQLKKFAGEKKLDLQNWTLLAGTQMDIAELAQMIGFRYKKNASGNFTHSSLITILDKDGIIENQSEGLNQSAEKLIAILNK
ncbi:MAG: SCO family protein [Bacteroidetes bacterium]|nr:SCO family protein [Bacteroidota bacterium]